MIVSDVGKLTFLAVVTVGIFAMVLTGQAEWSDVELLIGSIIGYLFGNGVNAVRKRAPSPVIVPSVDDDQFVTVSGPHTNEPPPEVEEGVVDVWKDRDWS